jgi:hypothetical protein
MMQCRKMPEKTAAAATAAAAAATAAADGTVGRDRLLANAGVLPAVHELGIQQQQHKYLKVL